MGDSKILGMPWYSGGCQVAGAVVSIQWLNAA